jgi:hypothetical protein
MFFALELITPLIFLKRITDAKIHKAAFVLFGMANVFIETGGLLKGKRRGLKLYYDIYYGTNKRDDKKEGNEFLYDRKEPGTYNRNPALYLLWTKCAKASDTSISMNFNATLGVSTLITSQLNSKVISRFRIILKLSPT